MSSDEAFRSNSDAPETAVAEVTDVATAEDPGYRLRHNVVPHRLSAEERARGVQRSVEIRRQRALERRQEAGKARRTTLEAMREMLEDGPRCLGPFSDAVDRVGAPGENEAGMRAVERMLQATGQLEPDGRADAFRELIAMGAEGRARLRVELTERTASFELREGSPEAS